MTYVEKLAALDDVRALGCHVPHRHANRVCNVMGEGDLCRIDGFVFEVEDFFAFLQSHHAAHALLEDLQLLNVFVVGDEVHDHLVVFLALLHGDGAHEFGFHVGWRTVVGIIGIIRVGLGITRAVIVVIVVIVVAVVVIIVCVLNESVEWGEDVDCFVKRVKSCKKERSQRYEKAYLRHLHRAQVPHRLPVRHAPRPGLA